MPACPSTIRRLSAAQNASLCGRKSRGKLYDHELTNANAIVMGATFPSTAPRSSAGLRMLPQLLHIQHVTLDVYSK